MILFTRRRFRAIFETLEHSQWSEEARDSKFGGGVLIYSELLRRCYKNLSWLYVCMSLGRRSWIYSRLRILNGNSRTSMLAWSLARVNKLEQLQSFGFGQFWSRQHAVELILLSARTGTTNSEGDSMREGCAAGNGHITNGRSITKWEYIWTRIEIRRGSAAGTSGTSYNF